MPNEIKLVREIRDKVYEAVEGVYSGDCKNLTVGRLEDTFAMLNELEAKLKARIVLAE
jgi:hypothetical protein